MTKNILGLILVMAVCGCDFGANNDSKTYLEPAMIKGSWIRYKEIQSAIPGLYSKDSVLYRIGIDSLPYIGPYYVKNPMTFYTAYSQGGMGYGYVYNDSESYDYDREMSSLSYTLVQGLPGPTTQTVVTFSMPNPDSMFVVLGTDSFGVHRR